jgi:hypothetical protein
MNFEKKHWVDPESGQKSSEYRADGAVCTHLELTSPIAKQFAAYGLIHADLLDAQTWLELAHSLLPSAEKPSDPQRDRYIQPSDVKTFNHIKALWFAALIIYAKCFAKTEGRGVKLERANIPKPLRAQHDKLITYRNTIVAHAGKTNMEHANTHLVFHPNAQERRYWIQPNLFRIDFVDDRGDLTTFEQMISTAISHVSGKMGELKATIFQRELNTQPFEFWFAKAE